MKATSQDIMALVPGATFEHTGGNVWTVIVGPFSIGPFHGDGQPAEAAVYVMDGLDQQVRCETLESVLAILEESIRDRDGWGGCTLGPEPGTQEDA